VATSHRQDPSADRKSDLNECIVDGSLIEPPTPSGTMILARFVVLFSLGCNPSFGKSSGTESAVSRALGVSQKG
jgi:hypothetical protein